MKIGIIDADLNDNGTRFPNLALMKISGYEKELGNEVSIIGNGQLVDDFDKVYVSKVFTKTKFDTLLPDGIELIKGGTGFYLEKAPQLPSEIEHHKPDYDLYKTHPEFESFNEYYKDFSLGFTTRGCFRKCPFCVNRNYNRVQFHAPIEEFYDEHKKKICLLDDNIFGYADWQRTFDSIMELKKPFQYKQGLDVRLISDTKAKYLAKANYIPEITFAFDNIKDKDEIEKGFITYRRHCHKHTKSYVLCGFDSVGLQDIRNVFERLRILNRYKIMPYIMRFESVYRNVRWRQIYSNIAAYCNQPQFYHKLEFGEFCFRRAGKRFDLPNDILKFTIDQC